MHSKGFYKEYLHIVIPLMLQGLVTTLVSMVDNLMVGQLGDTAISAVAVSNKILGILTFTLFAVSAAGSVFIAQYYGARERLKQREVFRVTVLLSIAVLTVLGSIFLMMPAQVIQFFVQHKAIEQMALEYMLIMLIGYVPFLFAVNYSSALKVVGQVRMPLVASLTGVAINAMLNYMFIFGHFGMPAMGVKGAAVATVVARFCECAIVYVFVCKGQYDFYTKLNQVHHISKDVLRAVVAKSTPLIFNEIIWSFAQATMLKIYAFRGETVISALSITEITTSIFFSLAIGMAGATPVFVSQRLGAGQLDEAYHNGKRLLKLSSVASIGLGAMIYAMSFVIPNLYQVSKESHDLAVQMIQMMGMLYFIYLINTQCYFIMRSGGDMKATLIMDGVFLWALNIPVLSYASYATALPIVTVYFIGQLCETVKLFVSLYFFKRKGWVKNLTTS